MTTRVVNKKHGEPYDLYVGRPSCWGNPFSHLPGTAAKHKVATRAEAIRRYREWLDTQPHLLAGIPELRGKILGCWCRPKAGFKGRLLCHAQILAGLADGVPPESVE